MPFFLMQTHSPFGSDCTIPPSRLRRAPFTQGRLWCGANLLDKFKLSISLTSRIVGAHCVRLLNNKTNGIWQAIRCRYL